MSEYTRKALLVSGVCIVGLVSTGASLGFAGQYVSSLSVEAPRIGLPGYLFLGALALAPVFIEVAVALGPARWRPAAVAATLVVSLFFLASGWSRLLQLMPRIDRALTDGPGAWMLLLVASGPMILYLACALAPAAVVAVWIRYRGSKRCPTSASTMTIEA